MPHDPTQDLARLHDFLAAAGPDVGVEAGEVPVAEVLALASEIARCVQRPGVPVTAYAVGLAVGRGLDPEVALERVTEAARAYAAEHGANPERRH